MFLAGEKLFLRRRKLLMLVLFSKVIHRKPLQFTGFRKHPCVAGKCVNRPDPRPRKPLILWEIDVLEPVTKLLRTTEYQDIRQFALHRVMNVAATTKPATRPDGFDLDKYIESGEFQYPVGPMVELKAKFIRAAAAHLYETPLSEDQSIHEIDAEHVLVSATVRDTAQLDWWLSGFGSAVEIQAPPELRKRMIDAVKSLKEIYMVKARHGLTREKTQ